MNRGRAGKSITAFGLTIYVVGLILVAVTFLRAAVYLVTGIATMNAVPLALGFLALVVTGLTLGRAIARSRQQRAPSSAAGRAQQAAVRDADRDGQQ